MYGSNYYAQFYYAQGYPEVGQIYEIALLDNIGIVDYELTGKLPIFITIISNIGLSDAIDRTAYQVRAQNDTLGISDIFERTVHSIRELDDIINVIDINILAGFILTRSLLSSLNLTESAKVQIKSSGNNIIKFEVVDGFKLSGEILLDDKPKLDDDTNKPKGSIDSY